MRPITAADLMNPEVLTVREDMPVEDLARFLIENEISGAPVESADGRLVGVVSLHDVVSLVVEETDDDDADDSETATKVSDTAAEALTASPMAAEPGNPGADGDSPEVGGEEGPEEDTAQGDDDLGDDGSLWDDLLVEDIMTPRVVAVSELATVPEIASRMLQEHLHRLLVLEGDEARGIISTSDLLGLLVDED